MNVVEDKVRAGLAADGIELTRPLPDVGTVRVPGRNKGRANDACAVTVLADRVLYLDHSSGAKGVIWPDGPGASRRAPTREETAEAERVSRLAAEQAARYTAERLALLDAALADTVPGDAAPYVRQVKGLASGHGARMVRATGEAVIEMLGPDGRRQNAQFIDPTGRRKRFWPGLSTKLAHATFGALEDGATIIVGTGWATTATCHEETGHAAVAAFSDGNLVGVAKLVRARYSAARLLIAADDDRAKARNGGRLEGEAAARAVSGLLALPELCRCCTCTDFNDQARCERRRGGA